MAEKLKSLFLQDYQIENSDLDTGCVDARAIKDGSITSLKLTNGAITFDALNANVKNLLLPGKDTLLALTNSSFAGADNPFVTRQEILGRTISWREAVASYQDLPSQSSGINSENDIRLVSSEKKLYVWQSNAWLPIGSSDSSSSTFNSLIGTSSSAKFFNYSFSLNQGSYIDLTHDADSQISRIIQIKEKILDTIEASAEITFTDEVNYLKSSMYSVSDTLMTSSSRQILGSRSVLWDPGIVGMAGEDEAGNDYRVESISAQDKSGLPYVIYLDKNIASSYTGKFNVSNVVVDQDDASLLRQKNPDTFAIVKNTSELSQSAKNVQVLGSKLSGISGILSIREDSRVVFNYRETGSTVWREYVVNYDFGGNLLPIKAESFHAVHILTSPEDDSLMGFSENNLGANDMYAMVFLEKGTRKPFFVSWCHNFGDPTFLGRTILDTSLAPPGYESISMSVKELKWLDADSFDDTKANFKKINTAYTVAITASVKYGSNNIKLLAAWLNNDAGIDLQSNWTNNVLPNLSNTATDLHASEPKILITPQVSDDSFYVNPEYIWSSKNYSIWIVFRNELEKSLKALLVLDSDLSAVFDVGDTGLVILSHFGDGSGYSQSSLFASESSFKCEQGDFDAVVWEDFSEPGLLFRDVDTPSPGDLKVLQRGTPLVVAANANPNQDGKPYEIFLTYKNVGTMLTDWSDAQKTNKYGKAVQAKIEPQAERNVDHSTFTEGFVSADNVHIFYLGSENGQTRVPSHIHNRFGTWNIEEDEDNPYTHRMRNFSDPIEYLDYVGISDFSFDLDDVGMIDFAAFYDSQDITLRGLYFANQGYQCKFAIWSNVPEIISGPGPRSGFTYFHHDGYAYIQGGYCFDGSIDDSMWRLNLQTNLWEELIVDNPPPRVFHLSDVVKNVAYKGVLTDQSVFVSTDAVSTHAPDGLVGSTFDTTDYPNRHVWVSLEKFGARFGQAALDFVSSSAIIHSEQSFYQYSDSIDPNGLRLTDVEDLTNKLMTTEGYRDCIIGFEMYNLTAGSHGTIKDVSLVKDILNDPTNDYVCIELDSVSGGSRSSGSQFLRNDQVVISYPGRPAFDQVVMYGGGSYDPNKTNGYPDDMQGGVTWPPDSVDIGGDTNIGDNDAYKDARTIFVANIDMRRSNTITFSSAPTITGGALYAPVPCISGCMVITDYSTNTTGDISSFPNFVLLNRSNAYRFKIDYVQDTSTVGRAYSFLGSWSRLDPMKANNGEPLEGITAWRGAKINHYGGIKPAPQGHADYPYEKSPSMVYFGGFTKSDFSGYYGNSLLIINTHDVNVGWSLIESSSDVAPPARCGNALVVVNRQVEGPTAAESGSAIEYIAQNDMDNEVWIACGNSDDLSIANYAQTKSMNDIWCGRFKYQKRSVNMSTMDPVYFVPSLVDPWRAAIDIKVNSGMNSFIMPNGLRTSPNYFDEKEIASFVKAAIEFVVYDEAVEPFKFSTTNANNIVIIEGQTSGALMTCLGSEISLTSDVNTRRYDCIAGFMNSKKLQSGEQVKIYIDNYYVGTNPVMVTSYFDESGDISFKNATLEFVVYNETVEPFAFLTTNAHKIVVIEGQTSGAFMTCLGNEISLISNGSTRTYDCSTARFMNLKRMQAGEQVKVYIVANAGFYNDSARNFVNDYVGTNPVTMSTFSLNAPIDWISRMNFNKNLNALSINDVYDSDIDVYNGSDLNTPDWIDPVMSTGDVRVSYTGNYQPQESTTLGERRWTFLAKMTLTVPAGSGSGDHEFYVGVYNNGTKSYVEFFVPDDSDFAFTLAFLHLSGGKYNGDSIDYDGRSYFDVGTGTLHLEIVDTREQNFDQGFVPYISKVENVKFAEIVGVDWTNFSTEIGINPFKTTWAGLIADESDTENVVYFGGRTHAKTVIDNVLKWNPPSAFIQDEQSDYYLMTEIDGSADDKFLSLRHANVVRDMTTVKIGDSFDYDVVSGEEYSAWGVAKIIYNTGYDTDKKIVIDLSFRVKPYMRDGSVDPWINSGTNGFFDSYVYFPNSNGSFPTGFGYVEFEDLNHGSQIIVGIGENIHFEGGLNYETGKMFIRCSDSSVESNILFKIESINYHTFEGPISSRYVKDSFANSIERVIGDKVGGEYCARVPGWVYTGDDSIDVEGISSVRDDRAVSAVFTQTNLGYNDTNVISIPAGIIESNATILKTAAGWTVNQFQNYSLFIVAGTDMGYYKIASNTADTLTLDTTGPNGTLGEAPSTVVMCRIMKNNFDFSTVVGGLLFPNDTINVPLWMINEMNAFSSYSAALATIKGIVANAEVQLFGKIVFKKKKINVADDTVEYYQYFIIDGTNSHVKTLTPSTELILSFNGNISSYSAVSDTRNIDPIYVKSFTTGAMLNGDYNINFNLDIGGLYDYDAEISILYLNTAMTTPTEVSNPNTCIQWQGSTVKVLFSFDEGETWKKYDEGSDLWIAADPENVIDEGMEFDDLINIVSWNWSGWNNSKNASIRQIPDPYLGLIPGSTKTIKMFVGMQTDEPANSPSVNGLKMNLYSGMYWEPKNFYQKNYGYGTDQAYLQVKMIGPETTRVVNNHATDSSPRDLRATIFLNENAGG